MAVVGARKPRKPWWQRILKRLVVAIVAFVAVAAFQVWRTHDEAAKQLDKYAVGDCLVLTKQGLGVHDAKTECNKDPSYTVASRVDDDAACPNDDYAVFKVTAKGDTVGKLCLMENLVPGHCYESDMVSKVTGSVRCNDDSIATSTIKVLSRQDSGTATCEDGQVAINYPAPAPGRTYCTAVP